VAPLPPEDGGVNATRTQALLLSVLVTEKVYYLVRAMVWRMVT